MCKVLIFGGTTEGRLLWEYCHQEAIPAEMYVATEYGAYVLERSDADHPHVHVGRLDSHEMAALFEREGNVLIVDATHPYATEVTRNIVRACETSGKAGIRVERSSCLDGEADFFSEGRIVPVGSVARAAEYLQDQTGNILVTTGSKELERYTAISGYRERLYVRVLPNPDILKHCISLGIEGDHLIGMQGPFSTQMNCAMIKEYGIRWLVTKDSGVQGGFPEKLQATEQTGIRCIVVGRNPINEDETNSMGLQDIKRRIKEWYLNE